MSIRPVVWTFAAILLVISPAQNSDAQPSPSWVPPGSNSSAMSAAASTGGSAGAALREPLRLDLYVGQAHVLNDAQVRRIVVGNGRVIQATALDERQILVIPEAPGQSTLHVWTRSGQERAYVITVVPADASRLLREVRALLRDSPDVQTRIVGDKVVVEGGNLSDEQAARLAEIGRRYPQLVNLVSRIGLERMIAMDVRMVEIKREVLENIGIKWNGTAQGPSFGIIGDLHRSDALRPGGAADGVAPLEARPRIAPFATSLGLAASLSSLLNFLVQRGDAVVLAEPRLACRSGGSARFVAGGELPIPHASGLGATSVAFKEYGVKFDVNPVAGESGVIAARIATEISAINFEVTVQNVPGLTNLREDETLVIAGLLTEDSTRSLDKVAGLGELPILGPLFRSRQFRERKSELVVFITPRFVRGAPEQAQIVGGAGDPAGEAARPEPLWKRGIEAGRREVDRARDRVRMVE
jgi:pilus assembly protein CpaC